MTGSLDTARVAAARLWAAHRFPYLASGLFATRVMPAPGIGGVTVDASWRLYADPQAVASWTVEQLGSVLVHHTGHLLRDHATRAAHVGIGSHGDARRWTASCDAEINDDLQDLGLDLPAEQVLPRDLGCEDGLLAEEYYRRTTDDPPPANDCGSGADGVGRPSDLPTEEGGVNGVEADLLRRQVAAEMLRQAPGTVPEGMRRWARTILEPKVDWRRALAAEVRRGIADAAGRVDYTYRRPSRRQPAVAGVVLPALRKPDPRVAVVCDTSASMSETLLGQALGEVQSLATHVGIRGSHLHVLSCDAAVHAVQRVRSAGAVQLYGGGGTDMSAGLDAAARLRPRPSLVVVLTDGYSPWPADAPKGIGVVVGLLGDADWEPPAWARTVRIQPEEPEP